ncbi:hypothetical protein SR914_21410 [Comamonas testosteroni]|uniref:Uncharacterized protein n=1 Tax=Comamonas testosteroni (strain DSM 14576 / KF-1) TaxID=399795 RepID=B7WUP7_COMTK|nr:hypothetical protein [Comamonas testosteroni]EED67560.1 hypothetical protein CtesDRAFT_PD2506 [Comamonas testosteroni KF-1]WQG65706.1 hypothetical protein SR914_21410 [Comamonas testosteroni]
MRSSLDFSSWTSLLSTVLGLLLVTCLMMGIRLLFMQTVQKRRERENRQINERLKTLIAAYKTLGSSFTGTLSVSPLHLRDLRQTDETPTQTPAGDSLNERRRRIRDAVEAALSDIILLGTEEQVELAARAAQDMVAGRPIETAALVTSLRGFIRDALDLEPIPSHLQIPSQGPARPSTGGAGGNRKAGEAQGSGSRGGAGAGGQGTGMGAGGLGLGAGLGSGLSAGTGSEDLTDRRS